MNAISTILKSIAWGLSILYLLVALAIGVFGSYAAIVNAASLWGTEPQAISLLPKIEAVAAEYSRLNSAEQDYTTDKEVRSTIENLAADYCKESNCLKSYDRRYWFPNGDANWIRDFPRMLERRSQRDEVSMEVLLYIGKFVGSLISVLLAGYLLFGFYKHSSLGWKRLLGLSALALPIQYSVLFLSLRNVDPLYGALEASDKGSTICLAVLFLFPFIFVPPLWAMSRREGLSVADVLLFWRSRRAE